MSDCKACTTPVDTQTKISSDMGAPVSNPIAYRSLVGALQYLTFTRPDISYVVQQVWLHMHDPCEPHLTVAKRILRYLSQLLKELYNPLSWPTLVYCDNINAVYLSTILVQHQRTKHVETHLHFIREHIIVEDVRVLHALVTMVFKASLKR
jgi:hypothetical protein